MTEKKRICFVCLGNIVRSPLAENMFRRLAEQSGQGQRFEVDSAGTGSWHLGEQPDERMRRVAERHGWKYSGQARQVRPADLDAFDLIVAMDQENRSNLLSMAKTPAQQAKIRLLREFDPQGGPDSDVPDPYYGGSDGFELVYQIVERSTQGLLQALVDGGVKTGG